MKESDTDTPHRSPRRSKKTPPKARRKLNPALVKGWTVTGAVIVALTFVAREAYLEPFKSDAETLRHEIEQYTPKGQAFNWRKEAMEGRAKCHALLARPSDLSLGNFYDLHSCFGVPKEIYSQELGFDKDTSAVEDLIEHAATYQKPDSAKSEAQDSGISTDEKVWARYSPIAEADERPLFLIFQVASQTPAERSKYNVEDLSQRFGSDVETLTITVNTLGLDVEKRREAVLQVARNTQVLAERNYTWARRALYSLFSIGVILNITGTLFGLKSGIDAD